VANVLAIEPFFGGSHKSWLLGLKKFSSHRVSLLTLPAKYWKWRMQGGAIALAQEYNGFDVKPDLILCSDMLDVPTFKSLLKGGEPHPPIVLYFHENQLTYPCSPRDTKEKQRFFGFRNLVSMLVADGVIFNSRYNQESFLEAAEAHVKSFPDCNDLVDFKKCRRESIVLPPAIDFSNFEEKIDFSSRRDSPPILLWNHRWEYDKNPGEFFRAVGVLAERNRDFGMIIAGEQTNVIPKEFIQAREEFADRIQHWGFIESSDEYAQVIQRAEILPVTSNQEFFGISVIEAMSVGCAPLLPNRLAYPELISQEHQSECLYECFDDLVEKLDSWVQHGSPLEPKTVQQRALEYSWENWIGQYDQLLQSIL
jgi:glycosyltransferase involved in cell wall biosynthesis